MKNSTFYFLLSIFSFIVLLSTFYFLFSETTCAASVNVSADVQSLCGNGSIDSGEQCDGSNLGGQTCVSRGYAGGTLTCNSNCAFNTSACASGGGGGGGGGGGFFAPPPETAVVFSGRAYPKSAVTILKDAQIAATTVADANANFNATISGLSGGNYIFSVYSEDNKGIRSSLLTFPISVTTGAATRVGGIFIAPTISVDKSEVKRGEDIAIFGQSAPQADIIISVSSDEEFFGKALSDKDGIYLYNFDTSFVNYGTHYTKSKASIGNIAVSNFSNVISFKVGTKTVFAQSTKCPLKGDLNNDCRVNLIDFSIAAYWYKRSLSAEFKLKETERLNGDAKVDLIDFSIMAYYWTG
jgi:hypothetical protein